MGIQGEELLWKVRAENSEFGIGRTTSREGGCGMIVVEDTRENRSVRNVVATMAIEGMYFDKEFVLELLKVANGEKSSEELRQEVIRKHVR